jgi:hypothetical protein
MEADIKRIGCWSFEPLPAPIADRSYQLRNLDMKQSGMTSACDASRQ